MNQIVVLKASMKNIEFGFNIYIMKKLNKNYWKMKTLSDITTIKSEEDLNKLNTKRLLAYYKAERFRRIRYREHWFTGYEYSYYLYKEDEFVLDILNKWEEYLYSIKDILNKRENIGEYNKQ